MRQDYTREEMIALAEKGLKVEAVEAENARLTAELSKISDALLSEKTKCAVLAKWIENATDAIRAAHLSICYRYPFEGHDAPDMRAGRASWCVWHLNPRNRDEMTRHDADLYDALMKTRGTAEPRDG